MLHREDIVHRRGPFLVLQDDALRGRFDADLLAWMKAGSYTLIAVVIDKFSHGRRSYRSVAHAYHYCLEILLERYCDFLHKRNGAGDVLAEARGTREDRALDERYAVFFYEMPRRSRSVLSGKGTL